MSVFYIEASVTSSSKSRNPLYLEVSNILTVKQARKAAIQYALEHHLGISKIIIQRTMISDILIRVSAEVKWEEKGGRKTYNFKEDIYTGATNSKTLKQILLNAIKLSDRRFNAKAGKITIIQHPVFTKIVTKKSCQ